jgi:hypothetical protein
MRFARSLAVLTGLAALAGCQDDPMVAHEAGGAGPAAYAGFTDPRKGDVHTGYVADEGGEPRAIAYQVVNGVAIWDGDVPLGPADGIAPTAQAARRSPDRFGGARLALHSSGSSAWSGGTIPYVVEGTAPANLGPAMSQITSQVPGVRFVQRTTQSVYLRIYDHGRVGYHQYYGGSSVRSLGLDYGLGNSKAILMHELGHVLGFQHEHQRCDRGSYIRLIDTNPYPDQFNTLCGSVKVGGYDRSSIMHYNSREFGRLHFTDLNGNEVQGYWGRTTLSSGDASSWSSLYPGSGSGTGVPGTTACTGGYCGPYNLRSGPGTGYTVTGTINGGVAVTIVCQANGTSHTGPWGTTSLWNKLGGAYAGKWISDAYVYTGSNGAVAPPC